MTTGEAPAPEDTIISTSTTLEQPPAAGPTAGIPGGETGRAVVDASATGRSGLTGGVDGGLDGGSPGDAAVTPTPSDGVGSTVTSTATTGADGVGDATTPTVPLAPGAVPGSAPTDGQGAASTVPLLPGDGVTPAALAPTRTNQSAGAVSNPALLVLGLALVFGGGVFLAVRNRHRA